MQKVPLVGITTLPETRFVLQLMPGADITLQPLDEYVAYDQTQQGQSDVDAEIVYVGYGIEAPEYNWDDTKAVTVRAKGCLILGTDLRSKDQNFFNARHSPNKGR